MWHSSIEILGIVKKIFCWGASSLATFDDNLNDLDLRVTISSVLHRTSWGSAAIKPSTANSRLANTAQPKNWNLLNGFWPGFWIRGQSRVFVRLLLHGLIAAGVCAAQTSEISRAQKQLALAASEYVGSADCVRCHQEIYKSYKRTGMGRSMSSVTAEWLRDRRVSDSVDDKNNKLKFEVSATEGKLIQSEYELGANEQQILRESHEISWIIGAGENGFGGLVLKGDYLFQAPLSFYSKAQRWELSPGYELVNAGFNRPILPGCISCHSGRPNTLPEGNGHFAREPFSELAIGCENCHGPGLAHVVAARMGQGTYEGNDGSIVNPAKLTSRLANDICMSCHQIGDVRVLKPGKDFQSFRPGTALDDSMSILLVPPKRESPPQQDLLEHYYSMTLSKCYRGSAQRLGCISCHDPHVEPTRLEAPAYFRTKCLACHTEKSCTVPFRTREQQQPADDCAGCHMKKRDVREISHSSITNHRILAHPDEAFPDIAFQQTTPALPDLIHLNPSPGREDKPLPKLMLLQAYGELVEKHPEYLARYSAVLQDLERTDESNPLVQAALGNRELHNGRYSEAVEHLQRALNGSMAKTILYTDLAEALLKLDRTKEAVVALQRATELDPFNAGLRKQLIVQLIRMKDYAEAQKQLKDYVERFPADSFMQEMRRRAEAIGKAK
jgi:hypothetical protein